MNLKKDPDIKIVTFDKGSGIAIMNSTDYTDKLSQIISDPSKFTVVPYEPKDLIFDHPVVKQQNKLRYFLKKYVKSSVNPKTFNSKAI